MWASDRNGDRPDRFRMSSAACEQTEDHDRRSPHFITFLENEGNISPDMPNSGVCGNVCLQRELIHIGMAAISSISDKHPPRFPTHCRSNMFFLCSSQREAIVTAPPNQNQWTPMLRARFLDHLAQAGNVRAAAIACGLSRQSLYKLRHRDPAFAGAWHSALDRHRLHATSNASNALSNWLTRLNHPAAKLS